MTYAELLEELKMLDESQLQNTVTVYVCGTDEFYEVLDYQISVGSENSVLDDGHPYIEI
jgi:hypothetical protein